MRTASPSSVPPGSRVRTTSRPSAGQGRAQELRLRRLPRAVGSLEGHEHGRQRYGVRREERPLAGRTVTVRGARPATRSRLPLAHGRARRERPRARGRERRRPRRPAGSDTARSQVPDEAREGRHSRRCGRAPGSRSSSSTATGSRVRQAPRRRPFSPAATGTPSRPTRRSSTTRVRSSCSGRAGSARPSASHGTWGSGRWRRWTAGSRPSTRTSRSS